MAQLRPETGSSPIRRLASPFSYNPALRSSSSSTTSSSSESESNQNQDLEGEDLEDYFNPVRADSVLDISSLILSSDTAASSDSGVVSGEGYLADIESELDESITVFLDNSAAEAVNMQNGSGEAKDPSSFLTEIIGGKVMVKLNSGIVYKGELQSVDGYMNIALENCKEFVGGKQHRDYGDVFLRGNNVMYICADY